MSLIEYNEFKQEVDFSDLDFLESLKKNQKILEDKCKAIPVEGDVIERLQKMMNAYDEFYDSLFGAGSAKKLFGTSRSAQKRIEVLNLIIAKDKEAGAEFTSEAAKFRPNKPNRHQRRHPYPHKK